jgi:hypothetical protein
MISVPLTSGIYRHRSPTGDSAPGHQGRREVLKQEVIGLLTRATGKKLLDIPQVQAVIFGYELAEPFGKTIAEEVKQIKMHSL